MRIRITLAGLLALVAASISAPALAYVGPGAGLSLLSALWGLVVAVLVAAAFVVMWPIRRWRRRRAALADSGADDLDNRSEVDPGAADETLRTVDGRRVEARARERAE